MPSYTRLKIIAFSATLFLGVFAFSDVRAADLYISNPAQENAAIVKNTQASPYVLAGNWNQEIKPIYSKIDGFGFKRTIRSSSYYWYWGICEMPGSYNVTDTILTSSCSGGTAIATGTVNTAGDRWDKISFAEKEVNTADYVYILTLQSSTNYATQELYITGDLYIGDVYWKDFSNNYYTLQNRDLVFALFSPNPEQPNLEMIAPPLEYEGGSYLDFPNWQVKYTAVDEQPENPDLCFFQIDISYGTSSYIWTDTSYVQPATNFTVNIPKTEKLKSGQYIVQTVLYDYCRAATTTILDTSQYDLYIDNINGFSAYGEEIRWDTYDIESACDDVASSSGSVWDDFRYGIECGLRKAWYWTVVPHDYVYDDIERAMYRFDEVFPKNIITNVQSSLANPSSTPVTLSIKKIDGTGSWTLFGPEYFTDMPADWKLIYDKVRFMIELFITIGAVLMILRHIEIKSINVGEPDDLRAHPERKL